jgi:hypothetical protein
MSGFTNPAELGENTPIFDEKQAYKMMREINKALWEGKTPQQVIAQTEQKKVKTCGFC